MPVTGDTDSGLEARPSEARGDTRRFPRRKADDVVISLWRTDPMGSEKRGGNLGRELVDLGPGGARVTTAEELARDEDLLFEAVDSSGDKFGALARVVWTATTHRGGTPIPLAGLTFREVRSRGARAERFLYGRGGESSVGPAIRPESLRKDQRFLIDDYQVSLTGGRWWERLTGSRNICSGVLDLSRNGAQVRLVEKAQIGTRLRFRLHLARFQDRLDLATLVVWLKLGETLEGTELTAGLKFVDVPPRQAGILTGMLSWFTSHHARFRPRKPG